MKVLINTPNYRKPQLGGVANHFHGLKPYWTERVYYNIVGSRNKPGRGKYWLPYDIIKSILKIVIINPDVVMVNTSLGNNALKRDSLFLNLAHRMGKKVVVHIHGFNVNYAKEIDVCLFLKMFKYATAYIVLSNAIKKQLEDWGINAPIYLSTTKVDNRLVSSFDINSRDGKIENIFYLGRVTEEKGIFIAIKTFIKLHERYPNIRFSVIGDGADLSKAKNMAKSLKDSIQFTGALTGVPLCKAFQNGDLYLFTSYHEGMPTSVLEAMCFGIPVVTRPVGGLVDFFEDGRMGFMVDSYNADDFAKSIETFLLDSDITKNVSYYNYQYGRNRFLASHVAQNLQQILAQCIK